MITTPYSDYVKMILDLLILAERILTGRSYFCNVNTLKADIDQYHYTFIEEETKNVEKKRDG